MDNKTFIFCTDESTIECLKGTYEIHQETESGVFFINNRDISIETLFSEDEYDKNIIFTDIDFI